MSCYATFLPLPALVSSPPALVFCFNVCFACHPFSNSSLLSPSHATPHCFLCNGRSLRFHQLIELP